MYLCYSMSNALLLVIQKQLSTEASALYPIRGEWVGVGMSNEFSQWANFQYNIKINFKAKKKWKCKQYTEGNVTENKGKRKTHQQFHKKFITNLDQIEIQEQNLFSIETFRPLSKLSLFAVEGVSL